MNNFDDLLVSKDELTLDKAKEIANFKFNDFDEMVYSLLDVDYMYDLQSSGELFSKDSMLSYVGNNEDDESLENVDLEDEWNWYTFDGEKFHCANKDDISRIINDIFEQLFNIAKK